jgi:hypothetical protein
VSAPGLIPSPDRTQILHPDLELYNPQQAYEQFRGDSPGGGGYQYSNLSGEANNYQYPQQPVIRNLPLDARGNVDEWAAMIAKQSEMAKFQQERAM